jgi:3-isopropylmalate dehydratase small subunit
MSALFGRAFVYGDGINTDMLAPGIYMKHPIATIAEHCLESVDPDFARTVKPGDVVVAGQGFGIGSSREHVAQAMKAWGVRAVVGASFARIFRRNCVNLGLPVLESPDAAAAARRGSRVRIDTDTGEVDVDGKRYETAPIPPLVGELQAAGGLVPWTARRAEER